HETPQPGRGGPVDPLEAVGGNVLADGGGVGREIDQAPPGLLVSGHAGRQRLEVGDRTQDGIDHHRAARGYAQSAGEEAEGVAVAELHRSEGEESALLELTSRRPGAGAPALEGEDPSRIVAGQAGDVLLLLGVDREQGADYVRKALYEGILDLALSVWF